MFRQEARVRSLDAANEACGDLLANVGNHIREKELSKRKARFANSAIKAHMVVGFQPGHDDLVEKDFQIDEPTAPFARDAKTAQVKRRSDVGNVQVHRMKRLKTFRKVSNKNLQQASNAQVDINDHYKMFYAD